MGLYDAFGNIHEYGINLCIDDTDVAFEFDYPDENNYNISIIGVNSNIWSCGNGMIQKVFLSNYLYKY